MSDHRCLQMKQHCSSTAYPHVQGHQYTSDLSDGTDDYTWNLDSENPQNIAAHLYRLHELERYW